MITADLFTPDAAGKYIGGDKPVPVATLQWWRYKGRGPRYIKIARQVRYRRSDLDAFLKSGERQPEEAA